MKTYLAVCAFVLFSVALSARAGVEFKPVLGASSLTGQTSYDITFGGLDPSMDPTGGFISAESKLEFDLKAVLAHIGLEADIDGGLVSFEAGYEGAISQGAGKLRDRDWVYNDYVNNTMGYDPLGGDTLSDTKSPISIFTLGMKGRVLKRKGYRLDLLLDYEYQKLGAFYVYNIDGAYTSWMTDGAYYPIHATYTTPVLSYNINYDYYTVGFRNEIDLGGGLSLEATTKAGLLTYSDRDDHILRSKLSTGSGTGYGGDIKGALVWAAKNGLGFSVFADYKSFTADGKQTQVYYAGSTAGIPYQVTQTVNSNQLGFGGEVSFKFGQKYNEKKHNSEKIASLVAEMMAREKVVVSANTTSAQPATAVPVQSAQVAQSGASGTTASKLPSLATPVPSVTPVPTLGK